ncbi:hypothetical protein KRR55_18150 [Paeniglutamicibacter sp. ABSL32-1]|nr:hypothetical protein [Paeniglutamicibacter quisquiliarum]MBV1781036.1 hypothetical protein [Paeniglutamicibacter quisquiliarum]
MQEPRIILAGEPVASLEPRLDGSVLCLMRRIARLGFSGLQPVPACVDS